MTNWAVWRGDKLLGHFLAESLGLDGDTLYAYLGGRIVGAVAGGPELRWETELRPEQEGKDAKVIRH